MKKQSNNKLKCQITGNERISNATYLANKARRYGITVEEFKAFYVSKSALVALKGQVEQTSLPNVANANSRTEEDIRKMLGYNGSVGFLSKLREKRDKRDRKRARRELRWDRQAKRELLKDEVALSTEDAAVALELAQAEIERTKEKLVEKNQTSDRDRKNAHRRELYAEKKRQLAKNRAAAGCSIKGDQELIGA